MGVKYTESFPISSSSATMGSKIYGAVLFAIIISFAASDALDHDDHGGFLSVRIVGNVFCDTCHEKHFSKNSFFISGITGLTELLFYFKF